MHLKKRLLAIATLMVMVVTVLYGSTLEMSGKVEEPSRLSWFDRKDTIYFWYSDDTMTNFINSAAVAFGEREDVHVLPVLTSASEYVEALNAASLANNQLPDVYMISHDSLEKAYLAGLADKVDSTTAVFQKGCFPKAALDAVTYQNEIVAYPFSFDTSVLIYNKAYLKEWATQIARKELEGSTEEDEESDSQHQESETIEIDEEELAIRAEEIFLSAVPDTLDDLLTIADTFDVPEGVEGVMKWDVSDIFYNYWIVGNYMVVGGDAGDDQTNISIDNTQTRECLEIYKSLNQFFSIEADSVEYAAVLQDFIEGKIVFTVATTDAIAKLEAAKTEGTLQFEYGVTTMPAVSDELQSRSMSVTKAIAVNGYSVHKDLANKFAMYLTDECASGIYDKTGEISANVFASGNNECIQTYVREYAESVPLPKMMNTGNYWLLLEILFSKVWSDEDVSILLEELDSLILSQVGNE